MKTKIITSLDKFLRVQREFQGWINLLRQIGGPRSVIVKLERDMARNASAFLLAHAFPAAFPRNGRKKSTARRTASFAGNERAQSTQPAKKGKKNT